MTCEFVQVHYIFISEMIPTILQIQFLHAMAQQNHTGSGQVCDKEISIVLLFLTQNTMKEMDNVHIDVYITLWKEINEDYSAFFKPYSNSVLA